MPQQYDVIVIGGGSVGIPTALALAERKLKVLVLDSEASAGQGNNKKAIGGIRATHSDFGKIKVSQRSIEIFSTWEERFGDDIGWMSNGYSFPAYSDRDRTRLQELMKIQHGYGLDIRWVSAAEYDDLVPGINPDGLQGATYSPGDGSASPLLALNAFYFKSLEYGASYHFHETVTGFERQNNRVIAVLTTQGEYGCSTMINAAGNNAHAIGTLLGMELPVKPDTHEGAITEPVRRFFGPMVVDLRSGPDSANYYFYQNNEGQVVFCITPSPSIWGVDNDSTSAFFPLVARRMVQLYPRLAALKVRRSWRGQYPMTPDGFPIVGRPRGYDNVINAVGMCGQGFMLGPGLGELITRIVLDETTPDDQKILGNFDLARSFAGTEAFK
jgi:sarcosine oxidase, subunit beta